MKIYQSKKKRNEFTNRRKKERRGRKEKRKINKNSNPLQNNTGTRTYSYICILQVHTQKHILLRILYDCRRVYQKSVHLQRRTQIFIFPASPLSVLIPQPSPHRSLPFANASLRKFCVRTDAPEIFIFASMLNRHPLFLVLATTYAAEWGSLSNPRPLSP